MKTPYWYFNGKVGRASTFKLPLNDLGLLRGFGIFDFLRTYNGKPFLLREHTQRFMRSAKSMGIHVPVSLRTLERVIHRLLKKNSFRDSTIRIVLTGGPSKDGMTLGSEPTFFIMIDSLHEPPSDRYANGIALKLYEHERSLPAVKTLNYALAVKYQKEMKRRGMLELLFVSKGKVLECNSSNIFIVKNKSLITSLITPRKNILIGTTRNFVIKHARQKYRIIERDIKTSELKQADEIFITASNKGIMPVVRIDSMPIGNGRVGPQTKQLMQLYSQWVASSS